MERLLAKIFPILVTCTSSDSEFDRRGCSKISEGKNCYLKLVHERLLWGVYVELFNLLTSPICETLRPHFAKKCSFKTLHVFVLFEISFGDTGRAWIIILAAAVQVSLSESHILGSGLLEVLEVSSWNLCTSFSELQKPLDTTINYLMPLARVT